MSDNFVAALAVLCIFGAPIGAFVVMRVLAHRERIEMIRRGIVPPPQAYRNARAWRNAVPPQPSQPSPVWVPGPRDTESADCSLRKGIRTALIGLAILIGLSFIGSDSDGPFHSLEIHPGPWLLGGLIPMFVGIAQILIAVLSGARLSPPRPQPGPGAYPGPGPYTGAPPPDARTYGPEPPTHSGYEELRRPTPPPDRR